MKNHVLLAIVLCIATICFGAENSSSPAGKNKSPQQIEANYTRAIEGRTADILSILKLDDQARSAKVHDLIMGQYRVLRAWHETNDARLKQLSKQAGGADASQAKADADRIKSSLKAIHDQFISGLSKELSPAQVDKVKDKMTYNKVQVTYDAYCEIVPGLTDSEKARIMELLKDAREEAMDCGSAEEKSAVFKKYKGKINNYLSTEGHDVSKAYKDWGQAQKEKAASKPGVE